MKSPDPVSKTVFPWLKANLGNDCLGVLTGTDRRALAAAVQIVELWSEDQDPSVTDAFRCVVQRMQPKARHLAYQAIAHVADWSHREELWELAGLAPLQVIPRCAYEPAPAVLH